MRLTTLVLFALLAAGCGGDEPDDAPPQQTVPQTAPPPADTTAADTVAMTEGEGPGAMDPGGRVEPGAREDRPSAAAGTADGTEGERLYTVQVAAFLESSLASEWTDRLRRQGMPAWTTMAEVGGRTFYRVRVGVAPTVTEARRVGSMIMSRYEWPVWVAPLTPADRPPEGAAQETRRLMESG